MENKGDIQKKMGKGERERAGHSDHVGGKLLREGGGRR